MDIESLAESGHGFTFGSITYTNGGTFGTLPPGYLTLLVMRRGAARITFDDRTLSLVGGECAVIANFHYARFVYQKHIRTDVAWCETRIGSPASGVSDQQDTFATKLPISQRMLSILDLGLDLGLESSTARNELRNAFGRAMLSAYLFESRQSREAVGSSRGLQRVRHFIEEHFSEAITLSRLAEVAAMTPNHLVAAFGRKFGITPIRYLWTQRARHAARLLVHTGMSGSEIAYACGYRSPYHFSRHIRIVYDKSPTEIRREKGYRAPSNTLVSVSDISY